MYTQFYRQAAVESNVWWPPAAIQRPADPDFGELVTEKLVFRQRVGNSPYLADKPLPLHTYVSEDGFVTVVSPFEDIIGYGDTIEKSQTDALAHLVQLREMYADFTAETATPGALQLRLKLLSYLRLYVK